MTNSEKAREICGCDWLKQQGECLGEKECHECSINNEYYYVMAMAKWKDEQLHSVDTIKKIVCYALRHTNIMLTDDLENGVNWELLIKKAIEHKEDDDE